MRAAQESLVLVFAQSFPPSLVPVFAQSFPLSFPVPALAQLTGASSVTGCCGGVGSDEGVGCHSSDSVG
jgi:hypothetical protein